jgi:hypothetical protein
MQPRYAQGSHFESCPAATGEADPSPCGTYGDGAHRCRLERGSVDPHTRHQCLCGHRWLCLDASSMTDEIEAITRSPRHAA